MTARVLVVDDLLPNVKLLEAKLTSEYFDVVTAGDGPSALASIAENAPDIVLLDVMMPGMDGFEVCRRIKDDPKTTHIPVVMVTALSDNADRVRGLEAGADDFLTKPLNDTALFARVRSLVRLKMLTDEWRLREQTSGQLGVLQEEKAMTDVDTSGARVLIIEEGEIDWMKISETLKTENADLEHARNSEEAQTAAMSGPSFDLVIVNLNLRSQDALRLTSHLRAMERTRYTPILLVAEEHDMEKVAKGLDLGVNDYLIKPIDRNELLARVRTQIKRQRYQERLRDNYERSLVMALTDSLTGLYNRRYVTAHLGGMIERHKQTDKPLALLMFDIDFFKKVNDTFGHAAGDEVLIEMSRRVIDHVRSVDTVARLGGEEFVAVLPDTEEEVALVVAERLRYTMAAELFEMKAANTAETVTISIGVAMLQGDDSLDSLMNRADEALYAAKGAGRNLVVILKDGSTQILPQTKPGAEPPEPAAAG
ncbi:PleD family two-component system response regulator [Hwanghaeella grinnelliae]|uniref:diguanylate cyclase n=1 Tax=Hwanghaeella grinnelliae TaxID=2500179 RepID=A0A3S2WB58_9PROT|nr:PleD family two-component system response regulator [Hwanghaeella grinnelliae]RVU38371.1 PleD family two-component system response regulator [Hwanghaeella grinnelliae]